MPESIAAALGEIRAAHTTAGGNASSTTPAVIPFPSGTRWVQVEGRNYSTAVVVQVAFVPYLAVLKTADLLATITDYSAAAQDGSASTDVVLSGLPTFANGGALYVGAHIPFRGVLVDVDAANGTAAVLSGDYRKSDDTWAALTVTDGSAAAGATFGQDGAITWTMPTDWVPASLSSAVATTGAAVPNRNAGLYWVRLKVSAALDASTTLNSLLALARATTYAELVSGRVLEMSVDRGLIAGAEHRTDAGTANVIVNVAAAAGRGFP